MDQLTLRELLRYGYAGGLCAAIAVVVDPAWTAKLVESLGDVLAPLVALAAGTTVYLVFRSLVGELFLWRLIVWIHGKTEDALGRRETRCKARYLVREYGVEPGRSLRAFAHVRDTVVSKEFRDSYHTQHSEINLLFVTAFVCGIVPVVASAGLLSLEISSKMSGTFGAVAIIAFGAGFFHDTVVCRAERAFIGTLEFNEVLLKLERGGFLTKEKAASVRKLKGEQPAGTAGPLGG